MFIIGLMQEAGLLSIAGLCLLGSTASQTAAPLFFGMVVDAAQRSMGEQLVFKCVVLLECL